MGYFVHDTFLLGHWKGLVFKKSLSRNLYNRFLYAKIYNWNLPWMDTNPNCNNNENTRKISVVYRADLKQ